jgi:hypothetical protein
MIRSSKVLVLLTVALLLVATAIPGHVGHLSVLPHSSSHDLAKAQNHSLASQQEQAGVEHQSDKDECDHAHELACSVGHCCYPVPETVLTDANSKDPHKHLDVASANLRDKRVDLPPPRSA